MDLIKVIEKLERELLSAKVDFGCAKFETRRLLARITDMRTLCNRAADALADDNTCIDAAGMPYTAAYRRDLIAELRGVE